MKQTVYAFIKEYDTCQRCKHENVAYPGLLQPLPIPSKVWQDISMDFIEGLPKARGNNVIYVVVDRLSKPLHFIPLKYPHATLEVAQAFMDNIFKLHGMPKSIVSDMDLVFTSKFWMDLFKLHKVDLLISTAYHPQTDGQTEVINKCLKYYLRCIAFDKLKEWPNGYH